MVMAGKGGEGNRESKKAVGAETRRTHRASEPDFKFKTTAELKVPSSLIDQIIGQDAAVQVIKKAAKQRRHVLLIGEPGTGKSLMGMAMAELLPKEKLVDALAFANPNDENQPMIRVVPAGKGRDIVTGARLEAGRLFKHQNVVMIILLVTSLILPWWAFNHYSKLNPLLGGIMFLSFSLVGLASLVSFVLFLNLGRRMENRTRAPKVIVDNFGRKTAPFYDATGAHAGALLGDVLHDPFQSYFPVVTLYDVSGKGFEISKRIDRLFELHEKEILRKEERSYEAIFLNKNELRVLGEINGMVAPVEVLSCNRYYYNGELTKITTSENKEIVVTPEHKMAVWRNDKVEYVEAKDVQQNDPIVAKTEDVINEQDIINTYNEHQQEQCKLYYQHQKIKALQPDWGYKRIAKAMNQPIGKTRWWHVGKHIPVPIQTTEWLKERGLLPLKIDNLKLPMIAKVLGATFGDGGIFENLNGIFLSSSNYYDTEEFSKDLQKIFTRSIVLNSELREGGEYGHSWCITNTNRNVIRFFVALGAPKGNKVVKELIIPNWVKIRDDLMDEFHGSLFGGELGISKKHAKELPRIEFAITGLTHLEQNRIRFLNEIITYLESKGVEITRKHIDIRKVKTKKGRDGNMLHRFIVAARPANIDKFIENVKINYCNLKKHKIMISVDNDKKEKLLKYLELKAKGLGAESVMKRLRIDQEYLYRILNSTRIDLKQAGVLA